MPNASVCLRNMSTEKLKTSTNLSARSLTLNCTTESSTIFTFTTMMSWETPNGQRIFQVWSSRSSPKGWEGSNRCRSPNWNIHFLSSKISRPTGRNYSKVLYWTELWKGWRAKESKSYKLVVSLVRPITKTGKIKLNRLISQSITKKCLKVVWKCIPRCSFLMKSKLFPSKMMIYLDGTLTICWGSRGSPPNNCPSRGKINSKEMKTLSIRWGYQ